MASDSINYGVRPNKNIERKLFVEMFRHLDNALNIREYRYIGLGGLWFADFSLIHRRLGLNDLTSIEKRQPARARFNRPFECVEVKGGETSVVLEELDLGSHPSIIWLDYESNLSGPALTDIKILAREVAAGSICLVTVNASVEQVRRQEDPEGQSLSELEALKFYAGELTPVGLKNTEICGKGFRKVVSDVLVNAFEHNVRSAARGLKFQLLLRMTYRDGAPMVTVGGLLHDADEAPIDFEDHGPLPFWPPSDTPYEIGVPILTMREKAALDQLMPRDGPPTTDAVNTALGFSLSRKKLEAYHRFYRHYPLFAEYEL